MNEENGRSIRGNDGVVENDHDTWMIQDPNTDDNNTVLNNRRNESAQQQHKKFSSSSSTVVEEKTIVIMNNNNNEKELQVRKSCRQRLRRIRNICSDHHNNPFHVDICDDDEQPYYDSNDYKENKAYKKTFIHQEQQQQKNSFGKEDPTNQIKKRRRYRHHQQQQQQFQHVLMEPPKKRRIIRFNLDSAINWMKSMKQQQQQNQNTNTMISNHNHEGNAGISHNDNVGHIPDHESTVDTTMGGNNYLQIDRTCSPTTLLTTTTTSQYVSQHPSIKNVPFSNTLTTTPAATAVEEEGDSWYEGCTLLGLQEDVHYLASRPIHQWIRSNLELFSATDVDVHNITQQSGRRRSSTVRGRVGIRCIHCAKKATTTAAADTTELDPKEQQHPTISSYRWPTGSVSYPLNISNIYSSCSQKVQNHFMSSCPNIPEASKAQMLYLSQSSSSQLQQQQQQHYSHHQPTIQKVPASVYYIISAKRVGLVDIPNGGGIRFGRDLSLEPLPFDTVRVQVEMSSNFLLPPHNYQQSKHFDNSSSTHLLNNKKSSKSIQPPVPIYSDALSTKSDTVVVDSGGTGTIKQRIEQGSGGGSGYGVHEIYEGVLAETMAEPDDIENIVGRNEDNVLVSPYMFLIVKQMHYCHAVLYDFNTRGKRAKALRIGLGGFCCKWCQKNANETLRTSITDNTNMESGVDNTNKVSKIIAISESSCRSFPSAVDNLASSISNSFGSHLLRCENVPARLKKTLNVYKKIHSKQQSQLTHGSQRKLICNIWNRLRSIDQTKEYMKLHYIPRRVVGQMVVTTTQDGFHDNNNPIVPATRLLDDGIDMVDDDTIETEIQHDSNATKLKLGYPLVVESLSEQQQPDKNHIPKQKENSFHFIQMSLIQNSGGGGGDYRSSVSICPHCRILPCHFQFPFAIVQQQHTRQCLSKRNSSIQVHEQYCQKDTINLSIVSSSLWNALLEYHHGDLSVLDHPSFIGLVEACVGGNIALSHLFQEGLKDCITKWYNHHNSRQHQKHDIDDTMEFFIVSLDRYDMNTSSFVQAYYYDHRTNNKNYNQHNDSPPSSSVTESIHGAFRNFARVFEMDQIQLNPTNHALWLQFIMLLSPYFET